MAKSGTGAQASGSTRRKAVQVTFKLRPDVYDAIEELRKEAEFEPEKTTVFNELLASHPKVQRRLRQVAP